MEKIVTMPKMSKINLDSMFFEIILSMKGDSFRARSSSIAQINNVNDTRPEATSKVSYENAIQKLIPKIEKALFNTFEAGEFTEDLGGKLSTTEFTDAVIAKLK